MTIPIQSYSSTRSFRFITLLSSFGLILGLSSRAFANPPVQAPKLSSAVTQSLLIRLETKVGAEQTIEDLLIKSQSDIQSESETKQAFAFKMDSNHFAVFHSFASEVELNTHKDKSFAAKLANAKDSFAKTPTMEQAEILLAKTPKAGRKVLVKKALIVVLEAKSGKEMDVETFLKNALPMVNKEAKTIHWYAIKLSANTYGIIDTFPDDAGRDAHLKGKVAEALKSHTDELLQKAAVIEKVDIIAAKS
jgi:quinol monooxygenase YgiN